VCTSHGTDTVSKVPPATTPIEQPELGEATLKGAAAIELPRESLPPGSADPARVSLLLKLHYTSIWRFVRRLGVRPDRVEDATQEVFIIVAGKLDRLEAGRELRFLFAVALRVAANYRTAAPLRREVADDELAGKMADPTPDPEVLLDRKRLRVMLDEVLDAMPLPLREVFVLHEIEGLSAAEIAETSGTALGTITSRLRRARELFAASSRRIRARYQRLGGMP
jgi:RNA polymerase sigma-70 factor (ECF subfamily)